MEFLERIYKTNVNGAIIEQHEIKLLFCDYEDFQEELKKPCYNNFIIVANHNSKLNDFGTKALAKNGTFVEFGNSHLFESPIVKENRELKKELKRLQEIIDYRNYLDEEIDVEINCEDNDNSEFSVRAKVKRGLTSDDLDALIYAITDNEISVVNYEEIEEEL